MNHVDTRFSNYEAIASEYYDERRHPTCANFFELSKQFIEPRLLARPSLGAGILEVGAGKSVVALSLAHYRKSISDVTLLDQSAGMLRHSQCWSKKVRAIVVGDACNSGLPDSSFDLVVSSLGDPYNSELFWAEAYRLLVSGGVCLYTTPAWEWASRFRVETNPSAAEFSLSSGAKVYVRSNVPQTEVQRDTMRAAGFRIEEEVAYSLRSLRGTPSAKIVFEGEADVAIVRGWQLRSTK